MHSRPGHKSGMKVSSRLEQNRMERLSKQGSTSHRLWKVATAVTFAELHPELQACKL